MNRVSRLKAVLFVVVLLMSAGLTNFATADQFRKGKTTPVSTLPGGGVADGGYPSISSDGRYVAFDSWDRLTSGDTDSIQDVYRKDMVTGDIQLVSVDVQGISVGRCYRRPSMSADGTKVAYFVSYDFGPDGLFPCGVNLVLLRDLTIGQTKWILPPSSGYLSYAAQISRDGRYVVTDLDFDSDHYVTVIDVATGVQLWTSGAACGGCGRNDPGLSISDNGRFVTFDTAFSYSIQDNDGAWDVYLHDRDLDGNGVYDEPGATKTRTSLVGILPDGSSPETMHGQISGDGSTVAFDTAFRQIYLRNIAAGTSEFVANTAQLILGSLKRMSLSVDARYTAFTSGNPIVPTDVSPSSDVYVWDRQLQKMSLVSLRPDGNQGIENGLYPSISSDGRYVAFGVRLLSLGVNRAVYRRDLSIPCDIACLID